VYAGFDPTADGLHVGSLAVLKTLSVFLKHNYPVYAIVGGATGLVGDPSGRTTERQLLDRDAVARNVEGIRRDIQSVLGETTPVLNNADWLGNMSFIDFAREVGKHFRVNNMLRLDSVRARLDSHDGISFTEFSYPLLQAFDFSHLYRAHGVRVQVGGSDQWGNITMGSDLIPVPVAGVTIPLLTSASGEKLGKSAGNAVFLSESKTSAFDFYQYFMRLDDPTARQLLPMLSDLPVAECEQVVEAAASDSNVVQRTLAEQVTRAVRGASSLERAMRVSQFLFGQMDMQELLASGVSTLTALFRDAKAPLVELRSNQVVGHSIVDVAIAAGIAASKSAVRRLVADGGLSYNLHKVTDEKMSLRSDMLLEGCALLLRSGKRQYVLVLVTE
jgi:tyrosyl-tRNA synthetase